MKKFYEAIQVTGGGHLRTIGFFKKKSNAEKYLKEFNTKVEVYPVKILERGFLD